MLAWFSSARGAARRRSRRASTPTARRPARRRRCPAAQVMVGGGTRVARRRSSRGAAAAASTSATRLGYPDREPGARVARRGGQHDPARAHGGELAGRARRRLQGPASGRSGATARSATRACWPRARTAQATRFGAPVDAGAVRGAHSTYSLDASATSSALDILALFGTGDESGGATYVARVRARPDADRAQALRPRARSPSPTPATRCAARRCKRRRAHGRTDRQGRVTLTFKRGTATATASGYEPAKLCACDELLRPARRRGVLAAVEPDEACSTPTSPSSSGPRRWARGCGGCGRASPRRATATS